MSTAKGTISGIWMNPENPKKPARMKIDMDDDYFSTFKKEKLHGIKKGDLVEFEWKLSEDGEHRNIETIQVLAKPAVNIEKFVDDKRQDLIINQLVLKSVASDLFKFYNPQSEEDVEDFLLRCVRWCEKRVWND